MLIGTNCIDLVEPDAISVSVGEFTLTLHVLSIIWPLWLQCNDELTSGGD